MQGDIFAVGYVCVEARDPARHGHDVLHCVGVQCRVYQRVVRSRSLLRCTMHSLPVCERSHTLQFCCVVRVSAEG